MTKHKELTKMGACSSAVEFAGGFKTLGKAWKACHEPSWLMWYSRRKMKLPKEKYVAVAIFSAEKALSIFEKKYPTDMRPRKAIDAAKCS